METMLSKEDCGSISVLHMLKTDVHNIEPWNILKGRGLDFLVYFLQV